MANSPAPTQKNGKICYLELPALDVEQSARFYEQVFAWNTRQRGDGKRAFDDSTGQVSGAWMPGRTPASDPGMIVYIMVDSVDNTIQKIISNGGKIVQPVGADFPEITARFSDPAGNILGLYQEPSQVH